MPRLIRPMPQFNVQREGLVDDLVKELRSPRTFGQPIVIEDPVAGGDRRLIHVIWDAWEGCPREQRTAIIQAAYHRAFREEYEDKISLAIGITVPEAVAMGLLPFQVIPARKRDGDPSQEEYRKAMVDAGASLLSGEDRPQLRFAGIEDAEAAMGRLQEMLPNSRWIITQELSEAHSTDSLLWKA
jgi:hypothetical protein